MNLGLINDNTKDLLLNNNPIDDKLHVIIVVSNPCDYKIRYKLTNEFIERMEKEPNIILYIVELVYNNQEFKITSHDNNKHLQLKGKIPLWHKENMINIGIKNLLPTDWKAVAWIDADIEFDSSHWALDTLKVLNNNDNNGKDFVQLFTHCIDMNYDKTILSTFTSFGYQYCNNFIKGMGINFWHPGFAWACNRKAYDKIGKLYETSILGSGDNIMCHSFIKKATISVKKGMTPGFLRDIQNYEDKVDGLKLGYIPGSIKHHFHGEKKNRNYYERNDILIDNKYDPFTDILYDEFGLIIPSHNFSIMFQSGILNYFKNRNEDNEDYIKLEELKDKDKLFNYSNNNDILDIKIKFILQEYEKLSTKKHQEIKKILEDKYKYKM